MTPPSIPVDTIVPTQQVEEEKEEQHVPWAYDSNNNELDCALKEAQRFAMEDVPIKQSWIDAERVEPLVLRSFLSDEQIDEILREASVEGVWPRGLASNKKESQVGSGNDDERESEQSSSSSSSKVAKKASPELESVPHHFAWTKGHVVLYMHNDDWFVETLPVPWSIIRGGMESGHYAGMDGVPVQDPAFVGSDQSMSNVRTIELHHYSTGGGLVTPGHRDCGSDLTISILLSDPDDVSGGDFVTYSEGVPKAHKMGRGDAILFNSEKLHNISTVTSGIRQSLVVELWPSKRGW